MSGGLDDPATSALPLVRAANRGLSAAWSRGALAEPPLDLPALVAKAERRERADIPPGHWEAPLAALTADLSDHARLNPLGRSLAHGQLVGILRQRIRAARLWRARPQILGEPIRSPVVILGQMRSGTTFLHRLMSCDPRFAFTRHHESLWPMAAHPVAARATALLVHSMIFAANPALRHVHPTSPDAPEEEFGLHAFSLHGAMFEAQWRVPEFSRLDAERDLAPVYNEFHDLLRTLRWRRRDPAGAIQLLKAPQFMADLKAVLDAFPDARLIRLRREQAEVAASSASLVFHQRRVQSDRVDRQAIGREWLERTRQREALARTALATVDPSRLITINYAELTADWRSQIAQIYDYLDLPLAPSVRERMAAVARSTAHRGHEYSPEAFGLSS